MPDPPARPDPPGGPVPPGPPPARSNGRRSRALAIGLVALLIVSGAVGSLHVRLPRAGPVGATAPTGPDPPSVPGRLATSVAPSTSGGSWLNVTVPGGPPTRLLLVDDPSDGYTLGYAFSAAGLPEGTTWTYANGQWSNISATAGSPPMWTSGGRNFGMAYDASDGFVLATIGGNGGTWSFHSGRWSSTTPTCLGIGSLSLTQCPIWEGYEGSGLLGNLFLASDPVDGGIVLLGATSYSAGPYWTWETWSYSNGRWSLVCPHSTTETYACYSWGTNAPSPRSFSAMGSAGSSGVLLFGGYTNTALNDTWTFKGGNWSMVTSAVAPKARFSEALEYDPSLNGTVMFGGRSLTPSATVTSENDTWLFSGGEWSNLTGGAAPTIPAPLSGLLSLAYEPVDRELVLGLSIGLSYGAGTSTWMYGSTPPIVGLRVLGSPLPADAMAAVTFRGAFLGGVSPDSFLWSFGDGSQAQGATSSHAYAEPGLFTVVLTVSDGANHTAQSRLSVPVDSSVSSRPTGSPDPTDAGLPVQFSAGDAGGTLNRTFSWGFGDGGSAVTENPTHVYSSAGNYSVDLWVNDSGGGRSRSSFIETVASALSVVLSANPTAPSLGEIVNFSADASGGSPGYVYAWAFGDGGTGGDLRNISHIFTTNGPFSATVRVTDTAGAVATSMINLTIALNLSVQASWRLGATPLPVSFASHVSGGAPGYSYDWAFGDGGSSSSPTPTHTYAESGLYDAVLMVTDAAGHQVQANWPVDVAPGGGPLSARLTIASDSVPTGGSTHVTAAIVGGMGGYTLSWASGGAACVAIGLLTESCGAATTGVYTVRLAVLDGSGEATVATANLTVGHPVLPPARSAPSTGLSPLAEAVIVLILAAALLGSVAAARRLQRPDEPPEPALYRAYQPRKVAPTPRRPARTTAGSTAPPAPSPEDVDPLWNLL